MSYKCYFCGKEVADGQTCSCRMDQANNQGFNAAPQWGAPQQNAPQQSAPQQQAYNPTGAAQAYNPTGAAQAYNPTGSNNAQWGAAPQQSAPQQSAPQQQTYNPTGAAQAYNPTGVAQAYNPTGSNNAQWGAAPQQSAPQQQAYNPTGAAQAYNPTGAAQAYNPTGSNNAQWGAAPQQSAPQQQTYNPTGAAQESPVAEETPVAETAPAEETAPAAETAPAEETAPAAETVSAEETTPAAETVSAEETAPAEETSTNQWSPIPQDNTPQQQGYNPTGSNNAQWGAAPQQDAPQQQAYNPAGAAGAAGAAGSTNQWSPIPQQQPAGPKKPINPGIIIGIVAAVVVILAGIIAVATHKNTINLADYVTVEYEGYDGFGRASVDFDDDKFYEDVIKKSKLDETDIVEEWDLYSSINYDLDKSSELSNGDKVTVSFTFDNKLAGKYKLKFKGKDTKFTVEGLNDVAEIDPFSEDVISVTFTGTAPNAYAEIENISTDEAASSIYYDCDKTSGLSVGDVITVTVSNDAEDLLSYYGITLTSTSKEYTVENVDQYVSSAEDVGEDILESMKNQTQDVIEDYFADESDSLKMSGLTYVGYYFLTNKEPDSWYDYNYMYVVFSATVEDVDSDDENHFETSTVYFPVRFENITKYADGTYYVDLDSTNIQGASGLTYGWFGEVKGYASKDTMVNELLTSVKSDYTSETVGDLK